VPFAAYIRLRDWHLISASPERFLRRQGDLLVSQPIKGTAPRGATPAEDKTLAWQLRHSLKEQAENVMIVDLTRNDLNRCCETDSVRVPHLFEIQTFPTLHQMVSTITGRLRPGLGWQEILAMTFPPGSMTGAPKVRVMELIDAFEPGARGVYAGSVGYVTPAGDFDTNVIIRTLVYDRAAGHLCYQVGGAITYDSDPAQEYAETQVKAAVMRALFAQPPSRIFRT
jgi:para-aminobenzoate synthetase component 1